LKDIALACSNPALRLDPLNGACESSPAEQGLSQTSYKQGVGGDAQSSVLQTGDPCFYM